MTTTTISGDATVLDRPRSTWRDAALAVGVVALGLGGAVLGHRLVPAVGILTWSVGLGVAAANLGLVPRAGARQLGVLTKKLLRVGIVLLGFSVSFASIAARLQADPAWDYHELPTGHDAMVTMPDELAALLLAS